MKELSTTSLSFPGKENPRLLYNETKPVQPLRQADPRMTLHGAGLTQTHWLDIAACFFADSLWGSRRGSRSLVQPGTEAEKYYLILLQGT